jgi:hypothetical protein
VSDLELALKSCQGDLAKSQAAEHELQQLLQRLWRKHSALKQSVAQQEKLRAQANQAELQHYKIAVLAQDAQKGMTRETGELANIKADLQRLLHHTPLVIPAATVPGAATSGAEASSMSTHGASVGSGSSARGFVRREHVPVSELERGRLVRERDDLLGMGVYRATDPVIVDLNARISPLA